VLGTVSVLAFAACSPANTTSVLDVERGDGTASAPSSIEAIRSVLSPNESRYRPNGLYVYALWPLPSGGNGHLRMDVRTPFTEQIDYIVYTEESDGVASFRATSATGNVRVSDTDPLTGQFDLTLTDGSQIRTLKGTFQDTIVESSPAGEPSASDEI